MSDFDDETTGIFQGDLIIKTAVELAIDDMRKNPWVIEDVFSSLVENPILKQKYGLKEILQEFLLLRGLRLLLWLLFGYHMELFTKIERLFFPIFSGLD